MRRPAGRPAAAARSLREGPAAPASAVVRVTRTTAGAASRHRLRAGPSIRPVSGEDRRPEALQRHACGELARGRGEDVAAVEVRETDARRYAPAQLVHPGSPARPSTPAATSPLSGPSRTSPRRSGPRRASLASRRRVHDATWTPTGSPGRTAASVRAPPSTSNGATSWVMSRIRTSGAIARMTPLQIATHGSRVPKSVSNEISGSHRDMMRPRMLRQRGRRRRSPRRNGEGGDRGHERLRARSRAAFLTGPTLAAFRIPGYPALWLAGRGGRFGWAVSLVAIAWITLQVSNSAFAVGATFAARLLPALLFGIPLGSLVDRFDRRHARSSSNTLGAPHRSSRSRAHRERGHLGLTELLVLSLGLGRDRHHPRNGLPVLRLRPRRVPTARRTPSRSATSAASSPARRVRRRAASSSTRSGVGADVLRWPRRSRCCGCRPRSSAAATRAWNARRRVSCRASGARSRSSCGTAWSPYRVRRDRERGPGVRRDHAAADVRARCPGHGRRRPRRALVGPVDRRAIARAAAPRAPRVPARGGRCSSSRRWVGHRRCSRSRSARRSGCRCCSWWSSASCWAMLDTLGQSLIQRAVDDNERGAAMGIWFFAIGFGPFGHLGAGGLRRPVGAPRPSRSTAWPWR